MNQQLEPTYLRYIYDGLIKGSIHPENAAELPDGLIGMYEEAFDERTSIVERQKLLQLFAIWALLKKEVSAAFVAEVLGESEDGIQDFISNYSAWFNSPESGKYQLYHERLKVYLLQKLSEGEVHMLHEKLIYRLEQAIEEKQADEFERYALEFLTSHLAVAAMLNGDGKKLIDLAYSQTHWQRQLKISKGYSWTNNGLKEVMSWASKYNDDEVIECGLQMVDLHHQEQNAAPQIVALVAEGDFDAALKRIEQFGGSDKEGLQRKFILYMLCLMELTLLDSKDKPNRKVGIEKLLKHLDEQLPVDHSVLNWDEFFSGELVFSMLFQCKEIEIEPDVILTRSQKWDYNWIDKINEISSFQLGVFKSAIRLIGDQREQTLIEIKLSKSLFNQNKLKDSQDFEKCVLNKLLAIKLEKTHQINSALAIVSIYCKEFSAIHSQSELSTFLYQIKEKINLPLEGFWKYKILQRFSILFAEIGDFDSAIWISEELPNSFLKSEYHAIVSTHLYKKGMLLESEAFIQKSIEQLEFVTKEWQKCMAKIEISRQLYLQEKTNRARINLNECLQYDEINGEEFGKTLKSSIILEYVKLGDIEIAFQLFNQITDELTRADVLKEISLEFFSQGKYNMAYEQTDSISFSKDKQIVYLKMVENAIQQGKVEVLFELKERCKTQSSILEYLKLAAIPIQENIGVTSLQNEYFSELATASALVNSIYKDSFLKSLAFHEASANKNESAIDLMNRIENESKDWIDHLTSPKKIQKWLDLIIFANHLNNQNLIDKALSKIQKDLKDVTDDVNKCSFQRDLIRTLLEIQKFDIAEEISNQVILINWRFRCFIEVFNALEKNEMHLKMILIKDQLLELFSCVENVSEKIEFGLDLSLVSSKLMEENESAKFMAEVLSLVNSIVADRAKNISRIKVIEVLIKQGLMESAMEQYALLTIDLQKRTAQKMMAIEFAKQGQHNLAQEFALKIESEAVKLASLIEICEFYLTNSKITVGRAMFSRIYSILKDCHGVEIKRNNLAKLGGMIIYCPDFSIEDVVELIDNQEARINFYTNLISSLKSNNFNYNETFVFNDKLKQTISKRDFIIAWSKVTSPLKMDVSKVIYALPLLLNKLKEMEFVLLQYTFGNLIIGENNQNPVQLKQRIDKLGLSWANDIKNHLPN